MPVTTSASAIDKLDNKATLTSRGLAVVKVEVVAEDVSEGDFLDLCELNGAELDPGVAVLVEEAIGPLQPGKLAGDDRGVGRTDGLEKVKLL